MKRFLVVLGFISVTAHAMPVSYEVPVSKGLEAYATFQMNYDISNAYVVAPEKFEVLFPLELTGKALTIVFEKKTQTDTMVVYSAVEGTATCNMKLSPQKECSIILNADVIRLRSALRYLKKTVHSSEELAGRKGVATEFAGDPIGILRY